MTLLAPSQPWQEMAAAKRASILESIPRKWRLTSSDLERAADQRNLTGAFIQEFLDKETVDITTQDTIAIVSSLQKKDLSAVQVTTAFCQAAAVAQQINNCLHEIFVERALARARELDDYFREHNKPLGPLHGLPVSLKDQFHVKGVDTTMGYVGWIGGNLGIGQEQTHEEESQAVSELLSLGAVLYCKTSLPQTLLIGETINNIIGRTLNPHNMNLSCGGSSGGEGALLALRGSSIGVGTDIGGSVRIPAAFCGIFSIKPTPERLSYRKMANTNPGQNTYRSTVGLLSTSLEGLELTLRSLISRKPWLDDPSVVPIPWRQEVIDSVAERSLPNRGTGGRPLKIGIFWNDGSVKPHPPVQRGLRMVVDAVHRAGHTIVDWLPPKQSTAKQIHVSFLFADGAHDVHSHLQRSREPLIPELRKSFRLRDPIPLLEYQDLTLEGLKYELEYNDYWNSTASDDGTIVDAVIMPVAPLAAVIPGKFYHTAYTEAINLMNYSAVVIPVTVADKTVDLVDNTYKPISEADERNWNAYDPEIYDGGPVGVQIIARKFEEEKILAIAKVIHSALNT